LPGPWNTLAGAHTASWIRRVVSPKPDFRYLPCAVLVYVRILGTLTLLCRYAVAAWIRLPRAVRLFQGLSMSCARPCDSNIWTRGKPNSTSTFVFYKDTQSELENPRRHKCLCWPNIRLQPNWRRLYIFPAGQPAPTLPTGESGHPKIAWRANPDAATLKKCKMCGRASSNRHLDLL
jgi:hypothetical protein